MTFCIFKLVHQATSVLYYCDIYGIVFDARTCTLQKPANIGEHEVKKTTLAALAFSAAALLAAPALAADLPSRRAPPVYTAPPTIPIFTWTGIFGGLNAGAAFGQANGPYNTYGGDVPFVGGGQVGFNYQFGSSTSGLGLLSGVGNVANTFGSGLGGLGSGLFGANSGIVIGAVADAQYLNGHNGYSFAPGANPGIPYSPTHYLGTVRGRLGVTIGRALVYGTGGYAYNLRRDGVTYGGGVEFGVTNNVTIGAEYLRVDLNRGGTYVDTAGALTYGRGNFNIARGFVNFKFDPAQALSPSPVVARY